MPKLKNLSPSTFLLFIGHFDSGNRRSVSYTHLRIAGRVDIVVDELQNEIVSGIGNGKILLKHLIPVSYTHLR